MNTYKAVPSPNVSILEINQLIVDSIQDIKGQNIIKIDLTSLDDAPADYFIICQGESTTQISSIAGNVQKRLKEELGVRPSSVEGTSSNHWVLVDYFNTVVHVFYPETRSFYELEELWGDAEHTIYESI